ncbi:MAG: hypothetical protein GC159_12330 [Phycisphaera sp.]|nr:hypothetical protein [Phycisphaera sp.]
MWDMTRREISVITLNTWKNDGHYARRLTLMGDGLAALKPDIVLLQEAFYTPDGRYHTARAIAEAIGLEHTQFSPSRRSVRVVDGVPVESFSGLAVLSRFALTDYESLDLPSDPADGQRIAQIVVADVDGQPVRIVNTHLTHLLNAHHLQQRQLERIIDRLDAFDDDTPVILGGDLNAEPHSPTMRWLMEHASWEARMARRRPQPTMLGVGDDPRQAAPQCLDYVLALHRRGGGATIRMVRGDRVLDRRDPRTRIYPSDHAGVRTVIGLPE